MKIGHLRHSAFITGLRQVNPLKTGNRIFSLIKYFLLVKIEVCKHLSTLVAVNNCSPYSIVIPFYFVSVIQQRSMYIIFCLYTNTNKSENRNFSLFFFSNIIKFAHIFTIIISHLYQNYRKCAKNIPYSNEKLYVFPKISNMTSEKKNLISFLHR